MKKRLTLKDLGAEKCINLLQPVRCMCGCGGYAEIVIEDTKDNNVFTIAEALLEETDCKNAWIFIIENWAISGAYTSEDGIKYFTTATPENNEPVFDLREKVKIVRDIIDDVEPHCIGVLQQTNSGGFRVVDKTVYDGKEKKNGKTNNRRYR